MHGQPYNIAGKKRTPQKPKTDGILSSLTRNSKLFVWITRCVRHSDRLRVDSKAVQKTRSDPRFLLCVARTARFTLGR